ncbi:MAG TPA: hypothetical protein VJR89_15655, partial [Polyangiales bacterium]|nr:hypothetical protein [Polyangiales bacterium]
AKRERSPFRAFDGVQAVPLYASAAACFQSAGDASAAREAAGAAQQLALELQQTLQAHAAQLEYFLARARYAAAAAELAPLRELCTGRNDAYAQWLSAVARELPSALARRTKEQKP